MFVRRLCLWSLRLIKETKECRELMLQRRIELQVSWLRVMLLAFFSGIPPTAYFRLELYRRRKDSCLRDFLLQNEWQPVSTMARSCEESNALNDKILWESFPATSIDIEQSQRRRRHRLARNIARFRPRSEDFIQWPLPGRWHGLYYVLRPLLYTRRKTHQSVGPD